MANRNIHHYLAHPEWARVWTVQRVSRHSTIRLVFEYATVIGGLGESLAAARHKHFGPLLAIEALRPDDRAYAPEFSGIWANTLNK